MGNYLEWKDLKIFQQVEDLSQRIWNEVVEWDDFAKSTVGIQLIRAMDSVSANIEEADGRYSFKDRLRILYIARGSLKEARRWLVKATDRFLFKGLAGIYMLDEIESLIPKMNAFIFDQKKRHMGHTV